MATNDKTKQTRTATQPAIPDLQHIPLSTDPKLVAKRNRARAIQQQNLRAKAA